VLESGGGRVRLRAPLEPNTNHKRTVFGGSLFSLGVLCGWSWVYNHLAEEKLKGEIVIASSDAQFKKPASGAFEALCEGPEPESLERFLQVYRKKGIARLDLIVLLSCQNEEVVQLSATYVVLQRKN
jgi:thioesterase domain-containing protein